jgi:HlyD family secretion protein
LARLTSPLKGRWRWLTAAIVLAAACAGTYLWYLKSRQDDAPQWRTAKISRGSITATVSATGTLNARVTVPVGSQVSGQIRELHADFNAEVRKGQLIARIDPETFEYRVRQAQADLEAARAQVLTAQANVNAAAAAVSRITVNLAEATRDVERKRQLVERGFIASAELDKARAVMDAATEEQRSARAQVEVTQAQTRSAQAVVAQREAQLASAKVDLERTAIRAPVDGIVIKRSIDAGQTVAASLQAPELFVIARDLHDMQVDTSVDEAEIGRIRLGQRANFTVDSYPGRSFSGTVAQVRKAAQTVQNVVTYTVVVSTANPDLVLIPGMTANVRLVVDTRDDVLKVPNAALRFRPPDWKDPAATGAWLPRWLDWLPAAHAQAPGGGGGPLAQFRERLERELALSDEQKTRLDAIFAAMRERFAAVRDAPDDQRPALAEKARAEMRERIGKILTAEQRKTYQTILADIDARRAAAGGGAVPAAAAGASSAPTASAPTASAPTASAPTASAPANDAAAKGGAAKTGPAGAATGAATGAAAGAATGAAPTAAGAGGAPSAGGGSPLQQFRARLERELAFTDDQRVQVDAIFATMREKFATIRDAPEAERGRLVERYRGELRERIGDILNAAQKPKYAAIIAEIAGRQSGRGRIFVLGEDGKPRAVAVRTGLTDGAFTEVSAEGLKEGDTVLIGMQGAAGTAGQPRPPATGGPPRLPF